MECADRIYVAGRASSSTVPNPYPFTLSNKQSFADANEIISAVWNTNIALGKTAISSSIQGGQGGNVPYFAVDGKSDTYWASRTGSRWDYITIDLGRRFTIGTVVIDWKIRPDTYYIGVSNDGISTDNASWTNADGGANKDLEDQEKAKTITTDVTGNISGQYRYIRISCNVHYTEREKYCTGFVSIDSCSNGWKWRRVTPTKRYEIYDIKVFAAASEPTSTKSKW